METKSSPGLGAIQANAWRLLVLLAPQLGDVGRSAVLGSEQRLGIVRGAGAEGAFGLEDGEVSREHAELVREGDAWVVRDLGSRNGMFANGRREDTHLLADGDVLRVGGTLLLWQCLDAHACQRLLLGPKAPAATRMIGASHELSRVHDEIRAAVAAGLPTLVLGESGVGKELIANELHAAMGGGPFVPVNCAALPEALAESELFGHARGAFTGANAESAGLFGQAHGGTLFLDEVGEMRLELQAKLLRALATGEVRGVGQRQARQVEVRVVAATNVDLATAVADGRFRGDLYARLAGSTVRVPALRERREDVLPLARHFLPAESTTIDVDAAEALLVYGWPWNVRELEHAMVAAGAAGARQRGRLVLADLPNAVQSALTSRRASLPITREVQSLLAIRRDVAPSRDELERALENFHGNVSRVAAFFARERRQIYRWAEQFGLSVAVARPGAPRNEIGSVPERGQEVDEA